MSEAQTLPHPLAGSAQPRRRWRLWLGVLLLLLLLIPAVGYGLFLYWSARDVRTATAEAERDLPEGWQLEDIEAHRAQVPDGENSALIVMAIRRLATQDWPMSRTPPELEGLPEFDPRVWFDPFNELSPEVQLDDGMLRGLQASLAKVQPARAEARKLVGMSRGRYPLQLTRNPLNMIVHSLDARTAATLLRCEAALTSQNGDADGALRWVRGIIAVARSVGDEPTLISMLARVACNMQAVTALERALAQGESPELAAVQALLEQELNEPMFLIAMRGERAAMHQVLRGLESGEVSLTGLAGASSGPEKALLEASAPTLARRSHGRMLRLLNEAVAAAALPPEEQAPAFKAIEQRVMKAQVEYDVVTALLMPAILKVSEANRRNVGNLRCAIIALALERYRRDHGSWPDGLETLVPKYLAVVPTDPGDGKPLRLARRPDGLTVYWVGQDGTDAGDKLDRQKPIAKGTDQGFQLWDIKHRRKPAPKEAPEVHNR